MTNEQKVICYYHNDLDGICSAAIVLKKYPEAECISCMHDVTRWDPAEVKGSKVFVVDFAFKDMEMLNNHCDLTWIDHHVSNIRNNNKDSWENKDIPGIRNFTEAGCVLTWLTLFPGITIPKPALLIGDQDVWTLKFGDETKRFVEAANLYIKSPEDIRWKKLLGGLKDHNLMLFDWYMSGKVLVNARENRIKKLFKCGVEGELNGHKTMFINSVVDFSYLGEYCYKTKSYQIAFIWQHVRDKIVVHLRSNTVDVESIAKQLGGGGHESASGFSCTLEKLLELLPQK